MHFEKALMHFRPALNSEDIKAMAVAAETHATLNRWAVSFAIVDEGGHMLWVQRLAGAPPATARISVGKAGTAALVRRESKVYEDMINGGRMAFLSAPGVEGVLEGGVPIMRDGHCVGAVGVSGVLPPQDVEVARAAIAALPQ